METKYEITDKMIELMLLDLKKVYTYENLKKCNLEVKNGVIKIEHKIEFCYEILKEISELK